MRTYVDTGQREQLDMVVPYAVVFPCVGNVVLSRTISVVWRIPEETVQDTAIALGGVLAGVGVLCSCGVADGIERGT